MEKAIVATILFADLMNSTEMAKNLMLKEYDEMIVDFQSIMFEVVSNHLKDFGYVGEGVDSEWSIIGDELRVFLYSGALRFDVRNVLLIAVKIKLAWLVSAFNQRILKEGRLVSRVGVGINCGKVIKDVRQWRASMGNNEPNIEGYASVLSNDIEGMLVKPRDSRALADVMITMANDADLRQRMGSKGKEKALAHSWQTITQKTVDFYHELRRKAAG